MKGLFIFLVALCSVSVWISMNSGTVRQWYEDARQEFTTIITERTVQVTGASSEVTQQVVASVQGSTRSNLELWFAPYLLEAPLLSIPEIAQVQVRRCSVWSIQCYLVTIIERTPVLFLPDQAPAMRGERKGWLVSADGSFVERVKTPEGEPLQVPLVEGLWDKGLSSEVLKAYLSKIATLIRVVREQAQVEVRELRVGEVEEYTAVLRDPAWEVVFSTVNDIATVEKEVRRLRGILDSFGATPTAVRRVELAYDKLGVVQLAEGVRVAPTKAGEKSP